MKVQSEMKIAGAALRIVKRRGKMRRGEICVIDFDWTGAGLSPRAEGTQYNCPGVYVVVSLTRTQARHLAKQLVKNLGKV
jgi:hypothetical protein